MTRASEKGRLLDALEAAPNGSVSLRARLLLLACSGRLGTRREGDESVDALLRKHGVTVLRDADEELPHSIPPSWRWVRLGDVADYNVGERVDGPAVPARAWLLELEDIEARTSRLLNRTRAGERRPKSSKTKFKPGDVLYGKLRPYLDKVVLADEPGYCTPEIAPVRTRGALIPEYLRIALKSPSFVTYANARVYGMNLPRLGAADAKLASIPVPPLSEQRRIVTKVGHLMALCDELEEKQGKKRKLLDLSFRGVLWAISSAGGTAEFGAAWRQLVHHFGDLIQSEAGALALRGAVLDLAVRGRLAEPSPSASAPGEAAPGMYEPSFEVPSHWSWAALGTLCKFIDYRGRTPKKTSAGVRLITAKNVRMGVIRDDPAEFIAGGEYSTWMTRGIPAVGDVLFTTEAPLGNLALLQTTEKVALAQRIIALHPQGAASSEFLLYALMSPLMQAAIRFRATGTTAQGIKASKLKMIPVPVPPAVEQRQIVKAVKALLPRVEALGKSLGAREEKAVRLADALAHSLVG